MTVAIAEALGALAGMAAVGVATLGDCAMTPLHPAEERAAADMLPRRRREFCLGRSAAHRALAALGLELGPVLMHKRRPLFPGGARGSLSHSADVAVAIVTRAMHVRALGVDLELQPPPEEAARLVLTPEETAAVRAGRYSCAEAFSAKEAAFKALEPLLDCGVTTLRQLRLERVEHGFRVWFARAPELAAVVSVRHLSPGILAWTVIE